VAVSIAAIWHHVAFIHHMKRFYISKLAATRVIQVTSLSSGRTKVIHSDDGRFKGIIDGMIASIDSYYYQPSASLRERCAVVFKSEDFDLVALYNGKFMVIHDYYFDSRFQYWEVLFQGEDGETRY
jgi:hypothetical protein